MEFFSWSSWPVHSLLRYSWPWKALTWDQLSLEAAGQAVLTAANLWMCTWSERSWPENLWNSCPAECFASCLPSYCSCSHSQTSVNQVESTVITCSVWSLPVLCDHYLFCVVITCSVWSLPVMCGHYLFCVIITCSEWSLPVLCDHYLFYVQSLPVLCAWFRVIIYLAGS